MRTKITLMAVLAITAIAAPTAVAAEDRGDFTIMWGSLTATPNENGHFKKKNRPAARYLKKTGAMEAVADEVNRRWALPRDIPVLFADVLDIGPAFFPDLEVEGEKMSFINFPGHFLTLELRELRKQVRGVKGLSGKQAMAFANQFVLAHEIGHALVHEFDLPVVGKEEDAVDGFAAYLLTKNERFGPMAALASALFFDSASRLRGKLTDAHLADEHSLHEQRVYQFLCWVYGSDRKTFKGIVGKDGLPRARARRCGDEWKQNERNWDRLLAPYALDAAD